MANLAQVYTVYGYCARPGKKTALGFNGERLVVELASYLLGNGYRALPLYEQQPTIAQDLAKTKYNHLPKRKKLEFDSSRDTETPMMDALGNFDNPLLPVLRIVHVAKSVGSDPASPVQTAAQLRAGESVV
ncbi:hypothetical protein ACLPJF_27110 [Pseudomonas vlassakiae]|uniref:hypothetical protein n=1 Tax=Pseudomonas TaxID=286 RepID=UPI000C1A76C4|nr:MULTISPECIES: hypothetical protein [unclassified Pseudomonas]AXQ49027.1 hypothetical protein DZC31_19240 [Stenotrophomonas rhizophila]MBS3186231.1 hypothetical protein [Pseudomonas sp. PCH44]PIK75148.1 hypothetical protein CQW31_28785 [Pseudomonas sp. 382]